MATLPGPDRRDFAQMNEDDWRRQAAADEEEVRRMLENPERDGGLASMLANDASNEEEKADNAIDYEDISDDDLPDEEDAVNQSQLDPRPHSSSGPSDQLPDLTNDEGTSHDTVMGDVEDDLFGGPVDFGDYDDDVAVAPPSPDRDNDFARDDDDDVAPIPADQMDMDKTAAKPQEQEAMTIDQLREMNFPSNQDEHIPDTFDSQDDFLKAKFPEWSRDAHLRWNKLFPAKTASMNSRQPARPPKPLKLTKLTIDIESDQTTLFRVPGPPESTVREKYRDLISRDLVPLIPLQSEEDVDLEADDEGDEYEQVAGFNLWEYDTVCTDFNEFIDAADKATPVLTPDRSAGANADDDEEDWDNLFNEDRHDKFQPAKKRKYDTRLPQLQQFPVPKTFNNFEAACARAGRRVVIDLNDPYILVDDEAGQMAKQPRFTPKMKRMANGKLVQDKVARFNFSNDDAYLALKENHQSKVRATLGNITVEHSLPALKLSWPYYQARIPLEKLFMEDLHRPMLKVRPFAQKVLKWAARGRKNRKLLKGQKVQDTYRTTHDLSLNDNSTTVMFEYSEQFPPTLSKFGMGSRIINYYRKKNEDDETRESKKRDKNDLGETNVLLPEDRSPFSIFGTVDPGETVPTLHNQMYRAPIFKHDVRSTDFVLGRSSDSSGSVHYLKPLEHIYAVGQTFPSAEVPGPHSRKVTTAQKNRMKMVAYRLMRKSESHTVALGEITKHIRESTDQQNRQKLKEFLAYDKVEKQWGLRRGETLMDEPSIRAMIKPEDVCLIDSMHVGLGTMDDEDLKRNLKKKNDDDEDENQEDDKEESFASKMAPWKTSKAFIDASAGKAMLQLHGEGDPTGHGYGFSFIKTSMKGGYIEAVQGPNATTQDAIERERKANGGHSYNVKKQEQMYNSAIKDIWSKQKATLSDPTVHDDDDIMPVADEDDRFNATAAPTPAAVATPMGTFDGGSQISRTTGASRMLKDREVIRIVRKRKNPETGEVEINESVITDPAVAKLYQLRRKQREAAKIDIYSAKPTGDSNLDRQQEELINAELSRLFKNKERRHVRERAKGIKTSDDGATPSIEGSTKGTGTTRKCANCGQVGHIKTNKKLCPLLNGTMKAINGDGGGFGSFNAPSTPTPTSGME